MGSPLNNNVSKGRSVDQCCRQTYRTVLFQLLWHCWSPFCLKSLSFLMDCSRQTPNATHPIPIPQQTRTGPLTNLLNPHINQYCTFPIITISLNSTITIPFDKSYCYSMPPERISDLDRARLHRLQILVQIDPIIELQGSQRPAIRACHI